MNFILNLLIVIIAAGFAGVYLASLIINLVRAIKTNNVIKNNPDYVEGKIIDIIKQKNRVYVKVEYASKVNLTKFNDVFELTQKEFNEQYSVGQNVKIYYANPSGLEKVNCFPTYLEGQKVGIEGGPLFTDIIMFVGGVYILITVLISELIVEEASGLRGLQWNGRPLVTGLDLNTNTTEATGVFQIVYLLLIAVLYFLLFNYVIERLRGMTSEHKQNYLKLCGIKGTAQVKTFKFNKSKNAQGQKEANMQIEFFTNEGKKINCELNSFLYSETQEEYIDILYDEKNPKNVVYMRK